MWSLGCIIAELYTGVPLFPAIDENELVEFYEMVLGKVPQTLIEQSDRRSDYFSIKDCKYVVRRSRRSRTHLLDKNTVSLVKNLFSVKKSLDNNLSDTTILSQVTTHEA